MGNNGSKGTILDVFERQKQIKQKQKSNLNYKQRLLNLNRVFMKRNGKIYKILQETKITYLL